MTTLNEMVSRVATALGGYASGTVNNRTGTTIVCTALVGSGRSMVGHQVSINAGALVARVTGFNDATGTITFTPSLSIVPAWNTFEVLPVPRADIENAIRRAIDEAGASALGTASTELPYTLNPELGLPADAGGVFAVSFKQTLADGRLDWAPVLDYEVRGTYASRVLVLRTAPPYWEVGMLSPTLRVDYWRVAQKPASGTDDMDLDISVDGIATEYMLEAACRTLHGQLSMRNPGSDVSRQHLTMMRECAEKAEKLRRRIVPPSLAMRVKRPADARYR